jgi:carboxymethylenebutenolidase
MYDKDFEAEQPSDVSRRDFFIKTSLAAGFALAVQPVSADTIISTDSKGLDAGEVKIPVGKFELPAYRAMPTGAKSAPLVIVIQEIFGVHEYIGDVCRRLAKLGYVAVAPELFVRQGDPSKVTDMQKLRSEIVSKVPDNQVMLDLDATVAWAVKNSGAHENKIAVTGFCWGGRITWLYAAHNPKIKAGVAWYGGLEGKSEPLRPTFPLDIAKTLQVPVLGQYAGEDQNITLVSVEKMKAALKEGKSQSEIVVYPKSPHGFHADYRPSYRKEDAETGWKRMLEWFQKHGVKAS